MEDQWPHTNWRDDRNEMARRRQSIILREVIL